MIMPEPDEGWGAALSDAAAFRKLFALLADEDVLKALFFLYKRENKSFTPKLLEKECGIPQESALDILTKLMDYTLVSTSDIELDDEVQTVYNFRANAALVPFLAFAAELITRPCSFYCMAGNRNAPYLRSRG